MSEVIALLAQQGHEFLIHEGQISRVGSGAEQMQCRLEQAHIAGTDALQTTLVIEVPAGLHLAEPLQLSHVRHQADQSVCTRICIFMGRGATATVVESYTAAADIAYVTQSKTEVFLEAEARLSHLVIQRESESAHHTSHVVAHQATDSVFESHLMNLGGARVQSDKTIYLQGTGASCCMNGIYGLVRQQHMAHHTDVFHEVSGCESEQDYRGMIAGHAHAVFHGRVVVAPHAQRTKAKQQNKNLLLSPTAEVETKPQLEIEANDVVCTHGATVGQLDEQALFYCEARGIARPEAIQLMIAGFSAPHIAKMAPTALAEQLTQQLQTHLAGGMQHVVAV